MKNKICKSVLCGAILFAGMGVRTQAQGWPSNYGGVMLQGFYWDSYVDTQWSNLQKQADELGAYFDLLWVPQSGYCNNDGNNMGYTPVYYFNQNSSFGSEEQLRSMIKALKEAGVGTIADVVINHRNTMTSWTDYPAETYKGVTYQMLPSDICRNDDGGKTLAWANGNGVTLSSNNDTGEDWDGCRDLDHKSDNVNKNVKAYLDFLLNDMGYAGFRYDMVKGYSAVFTADYNATAKPMFSVGEYWDGTSAIKNWIDGTRVDNVPQSGAFDFQFRYRVRDAINNGNWKELASDDMVIKTASGAYKQYAVTFVENHDTEYRSASAPQDPIKADTLQANAFMLAMPGTPCIFLKHWKAYKKELKLMIEARKLCGITNTSEWAQASSATNYYAATVKGEKAELVVVVGKKGSVSASVPFISNQYTEILSGPGYRYLVSSDADLKAWEGIKARIEEEEKEEPFTPTTATIYVRTDESLAWNKMNFYIWDSNDNTQLNGNWPGKTITDTRVVNGQTWYCQTFTIGKADYYVNAVFNTGSGSPQTVDVTMITGDRYYVIGPDKSGSKYLVKDVTPTTAVDAVSMEPRRVKWGTYDLMGRKVTHMRKGQMYVVDGKVMVK